MNKGKRKRIFTAAFVLVILTVLFWWFHLFAEEWAAKRITEQKEFAEGLLEPVVVDISFINKPVSSALDDIVAMVNRTEGGEPWEWEFLKNPETKRGFRKAIAMPGGLKTVSPEELGLRAPKYGIDDLPPVTLELQQVPVTEGLGYLGALTGLEYFFDGRTLVVHLAGQGSFAPIERREYRVTPTIASNLGIVVSSPKDRIDLRESYELRLIGPKRFCEGWRFDYYPGKNLVVVDLPETEIILLEASGFDHLSATVQVPFWNRIWPFRRLP